MRGLFAPFAALLSAACSVVGVSDTPEPEFTVVDRLGEAVEVRRYAPRVAVEARMPEGGRNAAFGRLFDYISGANDGGGKIAMTTPVATDEGAEIAMTAPVATDEAGPGGGYAMRFFLPKQYDAATAPRPTDDRLRIVDYPEQTIAVIRFSGLRDESNIAEHRDRLLSALDGSDWRPTGPAESWFYDPPWTLPPMRRNEIAIPVGPAE
jgi:hypothetical protein